MGQNLKEIRCELQGVSDLKKFKPSSRIIQDTKEKGERYNTTHLLESGPSRTSLRSKKRILVVCASFETLEEES